VQRETHPRAKKKYPIRGTTGEMGKGSFHRQERIRTMVGRGKEKVGGKNGGINWHRKKKRDHGGSKASSQEQGRRSDNLGSVVTPSCHVDIVSLIREKKIEEGPVSLRTATEREISTVGKPHDIFIKKNFGRETELLQTLLSESEYLWPHVLGSPLCC